MTGWSKGRVLEVANRLKELGVQHVYPGHCTGLAAEYITVGKVSPKNPRRSTCDIRLG